MSLAMDPLLKDLLTPLPQLGEKCGYESCPLLKDGWINIHLVPHSHGEMGLSKTFAEYYSGATHGSLMKIRVNWKTILDSTITELWVKKERRFTISDSELPYFFHWWARRDGTVRRMVYELIRQGRLMFVGGGWGMHDEACTSYQSVIDSYTYSLRKLNATFLSCGRPVVGWQADSFGHSREYASLVAQMGFDGLFVNPISFDDELIRMERRALEFVWRGSDDLGAETDIYTHKLFDGYWSPPGFCFGSTCSDPLLVVSDSLFNNVAERIEQFLTQIRYRQSPYYNTNQVMVMMGQRHGYFDAKMWFNNIDTLIQKFNERTNENNEKMHATYSTPACFLKAVYEENPMLETKQDDFFPYAYKKHTFITGMYTTRPTFKYLIRESNIFLQMAKQLHVLINLGNYDKMFEDFNWIMGVVQDHNIISGAMRDHVVSYYIDKLHSAVQWSSELLEDAFNKIRKTSYKTNYMLCYLNISSCPNTKTDRFHCNNYFKESVYEKNCLQTGEMLNLSDFFVSLNYIPQYYKQALLQIVFDAMHLNNTNLFTVTNKHTIFQQNTIERYEAMTLEVHRKLLSKMAARHAQAIARLQITIYNPLAWPVTMPVRLPIRNTKYEVFNPSGTKIKAIKIPIPDHVFDIPNRKIPVTNELVFIAENIPPLGLRGYFIQKAIKMRSKRSLIKKINKNQQKKYYIRQTAKENRTYIDQSQDYDDFDETKGETKIGFGSDKFDEINDYDTVTPKYKSDVESSIQDYDDNHFISVDNDLPVKNIDQYEMASNNKVSINKNYESYSRGSYTESVDAKYDENQMMAINNRSNIQNNDEFENSRSIRGSDNNTSDELEYDSYENESTTKTYGEKEFTTIYNKDLNVKSDDGFENVPHDNESSNTTSEENEIKSDKSGAMQMSAINNVPTNKSYEDTEIINDDDESTDRTVDVIEKSANNNETTSQNTDGNITNGDNETVNNTFDEIDKSVNNNDASQEYSGESNITNIDNASNNKKFDEIQEHVKSNEPITHNVEEIGINNGKNESNNNTLDDIQIKNNVELTTKKVDENEKVYVYNELNNTLNEIHVTDNNDLISNTVDESSITDVDNEPNNTALGEIQEKYNNELTNKNVDESEITNLDSEKNNNTDNNEIISKMFDESDITNIVNESNNTNDEIQKPIYSNESPSENTDEITQVENESSNSTLDEMHVPDKEESATSYVHESGINLNFNNESSKKNNTEITTTENSEVLDTDILKSTVEIVDITKKTSKENQTQSMVDILNKPKFKSWVLEEENENFKETSSNKLDKDEYYARGSIDNFIRNQYIQINLDEYRKITSLNLSNGVNASLDIQYYYYISDVPTDNTTWKPGAYIFRAEDTTPEPIIDFIETKVYKSDIVEEIHTKYSKYASFAVKLYTNNPIIEIDWVIGPIPIDDGLGKEVFIRYTTDLENEGIFYTDANGRQMLKRIRHLRPMYEPYDLDPIAGNFYPVTSRIYIEDPKRNLRFSIFNDRSQGGSSLVEGAIDLMVHRRILTDTSASFIIINETEDGKGLIVRGNHYVYLTKADYKQNRVYEKKIAKEIDLKPQIMFSRISQDLSKEVWINYKNEFSNLNKKLPIGVHILTLQEWNGRTILLRLENYLEKVDAVKSGIKKVNLKNLFVNIKILSLTEMNLAANVLLKDNVKLNWRINGSFVKNFNDFYGSDGKIEYSNDELKVFDDVNLDDSIILVPQQIRTFVLEYEYVKDTDI